MNLQLVCWPNNLLSPACRFRVVLRNYPAHRDERSLLEGNEITEKAKRLPTTLP